MRSTQAVPSGTTVPQQNGVASRVPVIVMLVMTAVGVLLPLVATPTFYYWDDTAAAAVGQWHRVAQAVLSGELPLLNLDMWRGGNFAAEAATGMLNPVMLTLMIGVYPIDNIAIAMTVAKLVLLLISAGGVYLLAREFGASAWMAAVAGVALSLSGWAIFMDGAAWINGTAIMAFASWAWWALRRCISRDPRPRDVIVAVLVASLLPSTGNPYGLLVLAFLFVALGIEALVVGTPRRLPVLVLIGLSVLLLSAVIYLPFLLTSAYGNRADSGIWNDEFLAVSVSELLGMSTPTHLPSIAMWGSFARFPASYLAWFVLPLLPWMRWHWLRHGWKPLTSIIVFGAIMLAVVLGPSQLWMFRWPARLLPFLYLALIVFFAVTVSKGFHRSNPRLRSFLTVGLVVLGVWIAVSDKPYSFRWHAGATFAVILATLVVARVARRDWMRAATMMFATIAFLGVQIVLAPNNANVADYKLPVSRSAIQANFADYADGLVVQVFDVNTEVAKRSEKERWTRILPGNMPAVAGYPSITAYSGIGFTKLDSAMCTAYHGGSCYELWDELWSRPKDGGGHTLADVLGAQTVVVTREAEPRPRTPAGWTLKEQDGNASVFVRTEPDRWEGTVSVAEEGVTVLEDRLLGSVNESVSVSTTSGGRLFFGRVAWPGYSVLLDGVPLRPESGPAGVLTVELPPGLSNATVEVTFTPPGLIPGLYAAAAGLLIAAGAVGLSVRGRRRGSPQDASAG